VFFVQVLSFLSRGFRFPGSLFGGLLFVSLSNWL
jgi:hypothetical protein